MLTVMTSFSAEGYEKYGRRCLQTLDQFLPPSVGLLVYYEAPFDFIPRRVFRMHDLREVHAFSWFESRHAGNLAVAGRSQSAAWKAKDLADGYSYRTDAWKFCRKVFAIAHAARASGSGRLVWIDADSYAFAQIPEGFLESLTDAPVTYLGRDKSHSECGFLGFNLPAAAPIIGAWENFYASDRFLTEREFHDSFLFDRARAEVPSVECRSISVPGDRGHVWVRSPLGLYLDHIKGQRKMLGYSPERRGLA